MTTDKDEVPKAGKIRHRSDSKREISKLGLFSSMGLAIVSFQVEFRFTNYNEEMLYFKLSISILIFLNFYFLSPGNCYFRCFARLVNR